MSKEKQTWKEPKPICEKLQYLIGVPSQYIDNYETLNKGPSVEVRKLCSLRSMLVANFTEINAVFKTTQLSEIKETARLVSDIAKFGIKIVNASSLSRNIIELNLEIESRLSSIIAGFKQIPAEWIEDIFTMPNGHTVEGVRAATRRYKQFKQYFPYQKYINWSFAETAEEDRAKNIFGSDKDLLRLLAEAHQNKSTKLFDFIGAHNDTIVVVDCENSDAQRLYDTLKPIRGCINKIILIDDTHTNAMWDELVREYTQMGVTVEHDELPRLKEQKSLVDLRMVAKTCEEHYKNKVQHFVLASSDSDIWALINSIPSADIMVLAEKCKSGDPLVEALTQNNIPCVFMEDLVEDSTELMDRVMTAKINSMIASQSFDIRRVVISAAQKLNLFLNKEAIDRYTNTVMDEVHIEKDENTGCVLLTVE